VRFPSEKLIRQVMVVQILGISRFGDRGEMGNEEFEVGDALAAVSQNRASFFLREQRENLIKVDQVDASPSFVQVELA
jgi:hypothetical protein